MKKNWYSLLFCSFFFLVLLIPVHKLDVPLKKINADFYGRDKLITGIADFRIWIGDRVYPKVIVGEDGWLIHTGELSIADYQNTTPYSQKELESICQKINRLYIELEERGIVMLIVIAPNKNTIYHEYVPDEIPVLGEQSRLDQIVECMDVYDGKPQLLDLRPALLHAKEERQIYHKTDSHWNSYGAFVAYQQIISTINLSTPTFEPYSKLDVTEDIIYDARLDMTRLIGTTRFGEDFVRLNLKNEQALLRSVDIKDNNGDIKRLYFSSNYSVDKLPSVLVFYDSFFINVLPYFKEHFREGTYVHHYTPMSNLDWIEEKKPDIVVFEFTERSLWALSGTYFIEQEK